MKEGGPWDQVAFAAGCSRLVPSNPFATSWPNGLRASVVVYTLAGVGLVNRGANRFLVHAGDAILLLPGVAHSYGREPSASEWKHYWCYFFEKEAWRPWLFWPEKPSRVRALHVTDAALQKEIEGSFECMIALERSARFRRQELFLNSVERLLLLFDSANPLTREGAIDERLKRVVEHIAANYNRALSLTALAAVGGLSNSSLSHLFRETFGVAPHAYITSLRIARARELLLFTAESIKGISRAVGYDDPEYFRRVFRMHTRMTPREFQLAARGENRDE